MFLFFKIFNLKIIILKNFIHVFNLFYNLATESTMILTKILIEEIKNKDNSLIFLFEKLKIKYKIFKRIINSIDSKFNTYVMLCRINRVCILK